MSQKIGSYMEWIRECDPEVFEVMMQERKERERDRLRKYYQSEKGKAVLRAANEKWGRREYLCSCGKYVTNNNYAHRFSKKHKLMMERHMDDVDSFFAFVETLWKEEGLAPSAL